MAKYEPKGRTQKDYEIDRRVYRGHELVLLEDRSDAGKGQYILAVEIRSKKGGKRYLEHRRFITEIVRKLGFEGSREGARAIFLHPEDYKGVLGEHWFGYTDAPV